MDHAPERDRDLVRDLVRSHALGVSPPVHARETRSVPRLVWILPRTKDPRVLPWLQKPAWAPEPALRMRAHKGEPKAPAKGELEAQIPETPAQMRELVQVLGPVAVTDLVQAQLGRWPGLTRADVEAMVHRRFHGAWWAWDAV